MTKRRDCFASWCAGDYYTSKQTRTKLISRLLYIHIVKEAGTITISKYLWVSPYNSQLLYGSPYIPWPALNKVAPSKCVIWPTAALFWIPLWQLGGRRQEFGIDKDMPTISYFGRFDSQNFNQKSQCAVPAKFRSEAAVQLSNWPCMYYDPENYISNRVGCLFWFIQAIDCVCVTLRLLAGNTWVDKRDVRMMQSTVLTTRISGMTIWNGSLCFQPIMQKTDVRHWPTVPWRPFSQFSRIHLNPNAYLLYISQMATKYPMGFPGKKTWRKWSKEKESSDFTNAERL